MSLIDRIRERREEDRLKGKSIKEVRESRGLNGIDKEDE